MKAQIGTAIAAAIFAFALASLPALAEYTVTERQKRDCQGDYHKYCGDYGLGSEALRACMSRNIKKVSNACVGALVESGDMTKAQADKLRGKATTTSKKTTTKKKTTSKKPTNKKVTSKSSTSKSSKKKTH
ncbi:MAG: hypothetical protein MUO37_13720 [Methyloceanibacter sp.]|nr:hypothetical protein [Methyloceanibacter sp.]